MAEDTDPSLFGAEDIALFTTKRCSRCKTVKTVDQFHRHSKAKDGRQAYCKDCTKRYVRGWEEANAERLALHRAEKLALPVEPDAAKTCRGCKRAKPVLAFYRHRGTQDGRASYCKDCARGYDGSSRRRKRKYAAQRDWYAIPENRDRVLAYYKTYGRKYRLAQYGLTLEQYKTLFSEQEERCAICQTHVSECPRGLLVVDHCHASGVVRGLLCGKCNSGLGMLGDTADGLRAAVKYLEQH